MADRKNVFVSFDYENDKHYKYLLEAWDANLEYGKERKMKLYKGKKRVV